MNTKNFTKTILLVAIIFTLFSCKSASGFTALADGKRIDNALTGIWTGSEKDQQMNNLEKTWEMNRKKDGTFVIHFKAKQDGDFWESDETGKWWTENGKYYEYHDYDGKTDIYAYTVLNKNQIKFASKEMSMEMNSGSYEYIDTRKTSSNKIVRDGSSVEKAIKVSSVTDEYEYVRNVCPDCQMQNQALIEKNGKMYDVLNLKTAEGKDVSYYFDINSFFGKF